MIMLQKMKHGGLALLVFVVLTGAFFWLTGTFSPSRSAASAKPAEQDEPKPAAPEPRADRPLTLAEIQTKKCEHNIRQLDCDECRYELGVVKVQPSITSALVAISKVEKKELVEKLRLTGEVQFDQTRVVDVVPVVAGRIITIKARLGQQVKQGDTLAVIHSSEFGEAKVAYLDAYTSFEIAAKEQTRQAAVNIALEKLVAHLYKTQTASAPGPNTDPSSDLKQPLGEWRSKLIGAAARLQKARVTHDREKSLLDKQASSKSEYEDALREAQTAQAEYDALLEEVQLSLSLMKLRADNAAKQAEAKLNAAEQRLHLFGLDDDAARSILQKNENGSFAQVEIKAPRSGTITAQNIAEGRYVDTQHSMFTIADLSNLWVWCDLYERDLAALHEKLSKDSTAKAIVTVPAFKDAPFAGVVDLVDSTIDEHTRTLKVRVQLNNPQAKLRPGMFATVEVELPTAQVVTMVPRMAVLSDEGKSFAFEHWKDDFWLKRNVTVGRSQDDLVEVTGLEPGATVAVGGAFLFKSDILRVKMGAGCAD
jgi:RND family efflux transporter MFP subunit